MRLYELVVIFDPETDTDSLTTLTARIVSTITDHNGEVIAQQTWGRRRLAYPIKHFNDGYYVLWHFQADSPGLMRDLENLFLITEPIIRYLTVRAEGLPPLKPDRVPETTTSAESGAENEEV